MQLKGRCPVGIARELETFCPVRTTIHRRPVIITAVTWIPIGTGDYCEINAESRERDALIARDFALDGTPFATPDQEDIINKVDWQDE